MRQEVIDFADFMEGILKENDNKLGWHDDECTLFYLFDCLEDEIKELKEALIDGNEYQIMREAADVANFSMMIWDKQRVDLPTRKTIYCEKMFEVLKRISLEKEPWSMEEVKSIINKIDTGLNQS